LACKTLASFDCPYAEKLLYLYIDKKMKNMDHLIYAWMEGGLEGKQMND